MLKEDAGQAQGSNAHRGGSEPQELTAQQGDDARTRHLTGVHISSID